MRIYYTDKTLGNCVMGISRAYMIDKDALRCDDLIFDLNDIYDNNARLRIGSLPSVLAELFDKNCLDPKGVEYHCVKA